ncbi:MAG: hypothetical protein IT168_10435 [Bryobacterales bacterium]|nr:hypothetical protein [Bryobacterales bacterium]
MKLQDLRKFAIQQQSRIKFNFGDAFQCVIDEHGIAKVPSPQISSAPPIDLEQELAAAHQFSLEPVVLSSGRPRTISRADLESLLRTSSTSHAADQQHHHDDE